MKTRETDNKDKAKELSDLDDDELIKVLIPARRSKPQPIEPAAVFFDSLSHEWESLQSPRFSEGGSSIGPILPT